MISQPNRWCSCASSPWTAHLRVIISTCSCKGKIRNILSSLLVASGSLARISFNLPGGSLIRLLETTVFRILLMSYYWGRTKDGKWTTISFTKIVNLSLLIVDLIFPFYGWESWAYKIGSSILYAEIESLSFCKEVKVWMGRSSREGRNRLIIYSSWMKDSIHLVDARHICWLAS